MNKGWTICPFPREHSVSGNTNTKLFDDDAFAYLPTYD